MSLEVKAGEHGVVRVFALGYRVTMELKHFEAVDQLAKALGVDTLQAEDVQIVDLSALREMGFAAFLQDAYGVAEDEIAPHAAALDALTGHAAVLRSSAFAGRALTLSPSDQVNLVATLHEPRMSTAQPMPSYDSAKGQNEAPKGRKPVSDKAMSGRIAMYALLAVFAFTIMFVWLAS